MSKIVFSLRAGLGGSQDHQTIEVDYPITLEGRALLHEKLNRLIDRVIDPDEKVAELPSVDIIAEAPRPVHTGVVSDRAQLDTAIQPDGMQTNYLVLSAEERAKGFVRPVRRSYQHVGIAGPRHPLRDLDEGENRLRSMYARFEVYPCGNPIASVRAGEKIASPDDLILCRRAAGHIGSCCPVGNHPALFMGAESCCALHGDDRLGVSTGRYWSQEVIDSIGRGCRTVTTMGRELAETYARQPDFYSSTFCSGCHRHIPVGADGEFVWDGTNERVGT